MAQDFVDAAYGWLLGACKVGLQMLPWLLGFALLGFGLLILARHFNLGNGDAIREKARIAWRLTVLAVVVSLLGGSLVQARKTIAARQQRVQQSEASRKNEPQLAGVVQFAPSIAILEDKVYTRTITLPPSFLETLGQQGVQSLAPYLSDQNADEVSKLAESFKKSGKSVVFTKSVTRRDEYSIPADRADVRASFDWVGAGNQRFYQANFDGNYHFHNPRPSAVNLRFVFPPPQGGGTIQDFFYTVAGVKVTEPDSEGNYSWTGSVPAGSSLEAVAHYQVTGAGGYSYALGSERRRIGNFQMVATSTQHPQYAKTGIFPAKISGDDTYWDLHNVLTSQSIDMRFPRVDMAAQLLDKTLSIQPILLVAFAIGLIVLRAQRLLASVGGFGLGLLSISMLSAYMSPVGATLVGALIALLLACLALRALSGVILALACSLAACAFLTAENGSAVLWVLSVAAASILVGGLRLRATDSARAAEG